VMILDEVRLNVGVDESADEWYISFRMVSSDLHVRVVTMSMEHSPS
jgi:hypothetical protein